MTRTGTTTADYLRVIHLPEPSAGVSRTVPFFPGSTIGISEPEDAVLFLARIAGLVGPGGVALISAYLQKDRTLLELAYQDPAEVTAAFNRNLLVRINRELGANFDLDRFDHQAIYVADAGRIEMHLVSTCDQTVLVPVETGAPSAFVLRGQRIVTEHSYKYTVGEFPDLAAATGLSTEQYRRTRATCAGSISCARAPSNHVWRAECTGMC